MGGRKKTRNSSLKNYLPSRRQHNDILPQTLSQRQHIPTFQLDIPRLPDRLAVQSRAIRALQIHHVRPHPALPVAPLGALFRVAELDDGVLLAAAGVLGRDVDDGALAAEQPAAARVQRKRLEQVGPFEYVQPPRRRRGREARRGGFVVFEHDGGVCGRVGCGGEEAGRGVVGFLLFGSG